MKLRLGTRGSALAVTQSEGVADQLRALGHDVELVRVKTGGDVTRGSLTQLPSLGVFAAELRTAVLLGDVDFAVHSLKDLPTEPIDGLTIAAVPARADDRDALCGRDGATLDSLPAGATIGTGSPRRVAQLRAMRPDLRFVDIRGNVGTRLARVADGDLDAVVLAAAGLHRLGFADAITDYLPILPAPGQGALAVECRREAAELVLELSRLDDPATREAVHAERAVLAGLGGGCAAPIAARGGDELEAAVFALDGKRAARVHVPLRDGAARSAVDLLLAQGAARIVDLQASRPSRLAELHDESSLWRGDVVLAGTRVFLPRADGELADGLRAAGAEVVAEPVTRRVLLERRELGDADWIALTSAGTVEALRELRIDIPEGAKVAAVGGATARAAAAAGIDVALVPDGPATAAALADAWPEGEGRVVIPGSALMAPTLADGLRAKGYAVEALPIYTTEPVGRLPEAIAADYRAGHFDVVVITAGSVAKAVDALLGWGPTIVAFGPPSAAVVRELGQEPKAVAATQDAAGLVAAIASLQERN